MCLNPASRQRRDAGNEVCEVALGIEDGPTDEIKSIVFAAAEEAGHHVDVCLSCQGNSAGGQWFIFPTSF